MRNLSLITPIGEQVKRILVYLSSTASSTKEASRPPQPSVAPLSHLSTTLSLPVAGTLTATPGSAAWASAIGSGVTLLARIAEIAGQQQGGVDGPIIMMLFRAAMHPYLM